MTALANMKTTISQIDCDHQHLKTQCAADAVRKAGKVIRFQLSITARCADCGVCFHFPNIPEDEDSKKAHDRAVVSNKKRILTVPILAGAYDPELN